jgi:hypothetical protein
MIAYETRENGTTLIRAYVSRDQDRTPGLFLTKPKKYKSEDGGWWADDPYTWIELEDSILPPNVNPQWEDSEPIEVEISIRRI